ERPPLPISLRQLPFPAEAAEDVEAWAERLNCRRGERRRALEEETKLQYYFGGLEVALLRERDGLVVVAAYDPHTTTAADLAAALASLSQEQRQRVVICF